MTIPGFSAEASLGDLPGEFISGSTGLGMRGGAKIVPQLRIIEESCIPVSTLYQVCGCEDEETESSHWCVVRR